MAQADHVSRITKESPEERVTVNSQTNWSSTILRTSEEISAGSAYENEAPLNDKNKLSLLPHEMCTPTGEKDSSLPTHLSFASGDASMTKSGGESRSHLINKWMTSTIDQFMYETVAEVFGVSQANHLANVNGWNVDPLIS